MGPVDPEGGDMKAIVAASPSSGSSSLNVAAPAVVVPPTGDRPTMTTITITGVDGTHQNNGEADVAIPIATPVVAHAPPSGYSSVYVNNRMHNIQLGGKTSKHETPPSLKKKTKKWVNGRFEGRVLRTTVLYLAGLSCWF
ncbi:hypothetical protein OUZ56_025065 [Daphnia magna]|uniref:Uncharacterized protein n=1 Tax=Daphnia magna TaxID=35525 RepID=A0ABQ9ZIQ7_9CRUS|nr:hypothetical protein OUZ56_025065 [Daphnia magna]